MTRTNAVIRGEVLSKCGWSLFEGQTFSNSIVSTFANASACGTTLDDSVRGQRLAFDR